jgi:hypothetical protein
VVWVGSNGSTISTCRVSWTTRKPWSR